MFLFWPRDINGSVLNYHLNDLWLDQNSDHAVFYAFKSWYMSIVFILLHLTSILSMFFSACVVLVPSFFEKIWDFFDFCVSNHPQLFLLLFWNRRVSLASHPSAQIHPKTISQVCNTRLKAWLRSRFRTRPNLSRIIHESGPTRTVSPSKLRTAFSVIIQLNTRGLSGLTTAAIPHSEPGFAELNLSLAAQAQNDAKHLCRPCRRLGCLWPLVTFSAYSDSCVWIYDAFAKLWEHHCLLDLNLKSV